MSYEPKLLTRSWEDNFLFELKPKEPWLAIFGLVLFVGMSLIVGGPVAIAAFPLGSLLVGWLLYRRYPILYCGFVWWLWFVGPLVRRIIDYRCGYLTPGPWTLTAALVTSISVLTLVKYLPRAYKYGGTFCTIAFVCCIYGWIISVVNDGFVDRGLFILLEWLGPVSFCFHLLVNWRDYPRYRQNIQRIFLWGTLALGIYGLIQYVFAPQWDRFWLEQIGTDGTLSFGIPEPFGIRVSSMMDAPQTFASMITVGLILLYSRERGRNLWANGIGYLSFLLSLARASWLGWLVSISVLFPSLKNKLKIRLLTSIFLVVLIILPVTTIEPFSTVISERFESFTDTEEDGSYEARLEGYSRLIGVAMGEYVGKGIKNPIEPDVELKTDFVVFDNGILTLLFSLGWIGGLPYTLSMLLPLAPIRQTYLKNNDLFVNATFAIIVGLLAQIMLKTINSSSMGMILWGFLGIGMSARNYYSYQNQQK